MTEILWGPYQEHHIAVRHGVTAELFEAAWVERVATYRRMLEERLDHLGAFLERAGHATDPKAKPEKEPS